MAVHCSASSAALSLILRTQTTALRPSDLFSRQIWPSISRSRFVVCSQPSRSGSAGDGLLKIGEVKEGEQLRGFEERRRKWFPHKEPFLVEDGAEAMREEVQRALAPVLGEKRQQRMRQVVEGRTYTVCPVVEGLYNLGNVSAVCRTAEALGFQSVHVVTRKNPVYKRSARISAGADKWLDLEVWDSTEGCIEVLRDRGYRIAVTCMDAITAGLPAVPIDEVDWTVPTAVFLGNEKEGVSDVAKQHADLACYIPMAGFVESFNIGVATAILLHHASMDRRARQGYHGDLSAEERELLLTDFYLRHSKDTGCIVQRLLEQEGARKQRRYIGAFMDGY